MNLIEQQSAAKDLPLQYLQQAVNGQNPNLTPWIATAELQRRTSMDQHMKPQGPQGPQPTVKDQVEQKAGLMATQAAQQAQAAQAQQGAAPPGPIPEGIPQPQPQPEQPVRAAHGGLMNAPVNFQFAHGGILGYAGDEDGSYVDPSSGMAIQGMPEQEPAAASAGVLSALKPSEPEWKKADRAHRAGERYVPPAGYDENGLPIKQAPVRAATAAVQDRAPRPSLQGAAQGLPAALPKPPPAPVARAPAAPVAAAPAPDVTNPMLAKATQFINEPAAAPTVEDAIAQQRKYSEAFGTDKPIGSEERTMLAKQQATYDAYAKGAPDRAFAAYAAGLAGVPGTGGMQYQEAQGREYTANMAQQQNQLKNIAELNTAQRTANEKQQTGAQTLGAAATLAASAKTADQAKLAGQIWDSHQQTLATKYTADKSAETQRYVHQLSLQMSQNQFNERQRTDNYNQLTTQARELARDEQDASNALKILITDPVAAMRLGAGATQDAQNRLTEIRKQKAAVMQGMQAMSSTGAKSPAAAGVVAPTTPTMAPDRASQFKVIR